MTSTHTYAAVAACVLAWAAVGCEEPTPINSELRSPQYRVVDPDDPGPTSSERGNVMITEINFAGSVSDSGEHDPDDVFIELRNMNPRPINISRWHLILEGDFVRTIVLPELTDPIAPNAFFVIAAKDDGAFGEVADVVLPELELGNTYVHIELRDADLRLQEGAGSESQRVFCGGYDTRTVRSMERIQLIFANRGNASRSWHAYSDQVGFPTISEGWRERTLASPGEANSRDYSGSAAGGGFE